MGFQLQLYGYKFSLMRKPTNCGFAHKVKLSTAVYQQLAEKQTA